jgi:hypothetical protein
MTPPSTSQEWGAEWNWSLRRVQVVRLKMMGPFYQKG